MKKLLISMVCVVLIASVLCSSAMANWSVTVKNTKAYADKQRKVCVGVIPKYTVINCTEFVGNGMERVWLSKKVSCLIKSSDLSNKSDSYYSSKPVTVVSKGTRCYQRPSYSSANGKLRSATRAYVIGIRGGWALVADCDTLTTCGFVRLSDLL